MTNLTVLPARRENISSDDAISYALKVLKPEYQTVEKLREYALSQVKSMLVGRGLMARRPNQVEIAYIEGKLGYERGEIVDILKRKEKIPRGLIKPLWKELKIILEDLLPVNTDENQIERFAQAYESITGKEFSDINLFIRARKKIPGTDYLIRGTERMKLGVVIETLLDAL